MALYASPPPSRKVQLAAIGVASVSLVLGALPVFLVSGLGVQIRAEFGVSTSIFGLTIALSFVAGALAGPVGGRLADRFGAQRSIAMGAIVSITALAGIGIASSEVWHLAVFLVIGGVGLSMIDPGLAVLVTRVVSPRRQGLAFGIKEASIPIASLVAGVSVPVVALTLGWRWAGVVAVIPIAVLVYLLPKLPKLAVSPRPVRSANPAAKNTSSTRNGGPRGAVIAIVAIATTLGMTSASGAGVFLPQSAVAIGLSESAAGLLLAAASGAGVIARVLLSSAADRRHDVQFRFIAVLLGVGALAMMAGSSGVTALLVIASVGVFAAAWAWSGLLFVSLVRLMPDAPGRAAGIGLVGLAAGNALGPPLFGFVAEQASFAQAWHAAAALGTIAAALMWCVPAASHQLGRNSTLNHPDVGSQAARTVANRVRGTPSRRTSGTA